MLDFGAGRKWTFLNLKFLPVDDYNSKHGLSLWKFIKMRILISTGKVNPLHNVHCPRDLHYFFFFLVKSKCIFANKTMFISKQEFSSEKKFTLM